MTLPDYLLILLAVLAAPHIPKGVASILQVAILAMLFGLLMLRLLR